MAREVQHAPIKDYLVNRILSKVNGDLYDPFDEVQLSLIGLGAIAVRERRVEVSSPLIRAILLNSIAKIRPRINFIPMDGNMIDVPALIRLVSLLTVFTFY